MGYPLRSLELVARPVEPCAVRAKSPERPLGDLGAASQGQLVVVCASVAVAYKWSRLRRICSRLWS
jgi:hypothetical protein